MAENQELKLKNEKLQSELDECKRSLEVKLGNATGQVRVSVNILRQNLELSEFLSKFFKN